MTMAARGTAAKGRQQQQQAAAWGPLACLGGPAGLVGPGGGRWTMMAIGDKVSDCVRAINVAAIAGDNDGDSDGEIAASCRWWWWWRMQCDARRAVSACLPGLAGDDPGAWATWPGGGLCLSALWPGRPIRPWARQGRFGRARGGLIGCARAPGERMAGSGYPIMRDE